MSEVVSLFGGITELCIDSGAGSMAAVECAVDRVELCSALAVGGLTPSMALLEAVPAVLTTHALIRPRPGDFCYDADEAAQIERDLSCALRLGAAGVVVGALQPDGDVDRELLLRWRETAGELNSDAAFVFHRSIDLTPDPVRAMDSLAEVGCTLVLTSGGAADVLQGADTIAAMVGHGGVPVLAGGGVTPENVAELIARTGVRQVHFSARATRKSAMEFRNPLVRLGSDADEDIIGYTDADRASAIVSAARAAFRR